MTKPEGEVGEFDSRSSTSVESALPSVDTAEDHAALERTTSAASELGKLGGAARARKLTPEQRKEIARKAAARRWRKAE